MNTISMVITIYCIYCHYSIQTDSAHAVIQTFFMNFSMKEVVYLMKNSLKLPYIKNLVAIIMTTMTFAKA